MEVIKLTGSWLEKATKVISEGGLVVFPSDTVYIIAVDPTNQKAVNKLLAFKNRWTGKAISVAVANTQMAKKLVEFGEKEERVYNQLLPGPFTVVSRGKHKVAPGIEAENGTLGIRIPNNEYILELVGALDRPITATSANLSGRTPHYSLESFLNTLSAKKREMIDLAVDGGKLPKNKPSTVIDISSGEMEILRRGDLVAGKSQSLVSKSVSETMKIGGFLIKKFLDRTKSDKALVLALSGDLGCGKTVFTRGIAGELGVKEKITSPTFNIYNTYKTLTPPLSLEKGKGELIHMDLYRLESKEEFENLKFMEMFTPGTLAVIEWPEIMGPELWEEVKKKAEVKVINFKYLDLTTREIEWS
ncbi:MAG: L-threonylcarbamoyladenylate synthase [Candidatus Shapirobacteria bacterium]